MTRLIIASAAALSLTACSSFPNAGRGGMAEFEPLQLAFWDSQDKALAPGDGLKFEITLLKHQLDLLVLEGAKACLPASVAQARMTEQRMFREFNGGLLLDAANQVEIQQQALHRLERRLDVVLASGQCIPDPVVVAAKEPEQANTDAAPNTPEQTVEKLPDWLEWLNLNNQFALDSALLTPAYQDQLARIVPQLSQSQHTLVITGHTDGQGSEGYNLKLAQQRAQAVAEHLIASGIDASRIKLHFVGSQQPYRAGASQEHHHSNRRVTLSLQAFD